MSCVVLQNQIYYPATKWSPYAAMYIMREKKVGFDHVSPLFETF